MTDIILELIRACLLTFIFILILRAYGTSKRPLKGSKYIVIGFGLLLFGALIDITDNYPSLNWTVVMGDTPTQAVLEKFVGGIVGFTLLGIGMMLWLPELRKVREKDEQLRAEKLRSDLVFDSSPVGMAYGKIGTVETARNPAFAQMLGYSTPEEMHEAASQMGGQGAFWADKEQLEKTIEKLKHQQSISNLEAYFLHKDGSKVLMLVDLVRIQDDEAGDARFYGFARDITKQKAAISTLEESENRLKTIIDAMPYGMFLVNVSDKSILDINPAALEMLGYEKDDLVGTHCKHYICPRKEAGCPAIDEKMDVRTHEGIFVRKDGSSFPILKTVVRLTIGDRTYLLESFIDISEQKRLDELREDVQRIMQHDMRSPVTSLISAANVALMDETVQGEAREMFENIKEQGYHILKMLELSLTMSKLESGAYGYRPERIDLSPILNEVIASTAHNPKIPHCPIEVSLNDAPMKEGDSITMSGNALLIESIISNLLHNAAEASEEREPVSIRITTGSMITMSFLNKGVVPKDIRETFFRKYSTSGKIAGTGLGTYSAQLATETMGGTIAMETSDKRNRTTITVTLPA